LSNALIPFDDGICQDALRKDIDRGIVSTPQPQPGNTMNKLTDIRRENGRRVIEHHAQQVARLLK